MKPRIFDFEKYKKLTRIEGITIIIFCLVGGFMFTYYNDPKIEYPTMLQTIGMWLGGIGFGMVIHIFFMSQYIKKVKEVIN